MRLISIAMLTTGLLSALPLHAGELPLPPCPMQPVTRSMDIPASGFAWLPGGDLTGKCEDIPSDGWSRKKSGALDLSVHLEGPEGSGRYWTIMVGPEAEPQAKPVRGVCLSTSTLGWRTLRRYSKGALPWLDDVNDDGKAEFILWSSFPLRREATNADYALMPWVYRLSSPDSLVMDEKLSRRMARSLAREYRARLDAGKGYLSELRKQAAEALERFAAGRCTL